MGFGILLMCSITYFFWRFVEPLHSGAYPAVMVEKVGARLPKFSGNESLVVKGSFDFLGLNYYTSNYAADTPCQHEKQTFYTDSCVRSTSKLWKWILYLSPIVLLDFLLHLLTDDSSCCFSCKKWSSHWSKGNLSRDRSYSVYRHLSA